MCLRLWSGETGDLWNETVRGMGIYGGCLGGLGEASYGRSGERRTASLGILGTCGASAYSTVKVKHTSTEQERLSMSNFEIFMVRYWKMRYK